MNLIDYCRAFGILIDRVPPAGVWRRFPTESHPHKKNGAVKFMLDHAFVADWANGEAVSVWKADATVQIDHTRARMLAQQAENETRRKQAEAAQKAAYILSQCQYGHHEYLKRKGFPEEQGNIFKHNEELLLCIPMRENGRLTGLQMIKEDGEKKFLPGQKSGGAEFCFDTKGPAYLCEGYATGLSLRAALKAMKRRYTIHICFSAGNMEKIAATLPGGFLVADHDASKTGKEWRRRLDGLHFYPLKWAKTSTTTIKRWGSLGPAKP